MEGALWRWKIISNYNNWDNQTIKLDSIGYLETNIENTETLSTHWTFMWRNIVWNNLYLYWNINSNVILNEWSMTFCWDSTINGNVYLNKTNLSLCSTSSNYIFQLNINWNLYNDWIIWNKLGYIQKFKININWNLLNKWNIKSNFDSLNIYWNLDNINWKINAKTYLIWE